MENEIVIYTDGSCLGNPGRGGWAAIIIDGKKEHVLKGGEPLSTNNRMEMMAIIEALNWLVKNAPGSSAKLFSDSNLLVQSIEKGWKRKANLDLWEIMDGTLVKIKKKKINVEWNWVKGHAGDKYNEKVDEIAVKESKKQKKPSGEKVKAFSPITKEYYCKKCKKESKGTLSFMSDSGMIRVDCDMCGNYIMFAEKTPENLKEAKKRLLITKKQLEKVVEIKEGKGESVSEKDLKKIKTWTKEEADYFVKGDQTLF